MRQTERSAGNLKAYSRANEFRGAKAGPAGGLASLVRFAGRATHAVHCWLCPWWKFIVNHPIERSRIEMKNGIHDLNVAERSGLGDS